MSRPRIEAVIFDLDGVIVDSEIWWDEVRQAFAHDHGRTWTLDDRHAVMGANSRQWSATMRDRLDLDLPATEIERAVVDGVVERYRRDGPPTIEGAVEAVRRIASRWPSALASSSHRGVIDATLEATGLTGVFRVIVSSDEVRHGKPAPDVFVEAAHRLAADPARTLVVEDSLNGLRAAKAAGMTTVLVPNASVPPSAGAEEHADVVLDRLAELDPAAVEPSPQPAPGALARAGGARPRNAAERPRRAMSRPAGPHGTDGLHPLRRAIRTWVSRAGAWLIARAVFRLRLEGRDRLPAGPAIYCFNHLSWADPFVLMAVLPLRPRLAFFGPMEADMSVGGRNRLMTWTGATIPYRPGKHGLLEATKRVHAVIAGGGVMGIAGEGRIQPFESRVGPLNEGPAYFAIREGVPLVPLAIHGTSWLGFGRQIRVSVGEPILTGGRPSREAVDALTERGHRALAELVRDEPERARPGRLWSWVTERFNDWPEGSREAAEAAAREDAARASRPG